MKRAQAHVKDLEEQLEAMYLWIRDNGAVDGVHYSQEIILEQAQKTLGYVPESEG